MFISWAKFFNLLCLFAVLFGLVIGYELGSSKKKTSGKIKLALAVDTMQNFHNEKLIQKFFTFREKILQKLVDYANLSMINFKNSELFYC
jgi:hypothetical protein